MKTLGAIKRNPTLADKAYEIIKEAIIANELKPGQILTEEGLAEKLQISSLTLLPKERYRYALVFPVLKPL